MLVPRAAAVTDPCEVLTLARGDRLLHLMKAPSGSVERRRFNVTQWTISSFCLLSTFCHPRGQPCFSQKRYLHRVLKTKSLSIDVNFQV